MRVRASHSGISPDTSAFSGVLSPSSQNGKTAPQSIAASVPTMIFFGGWKQYFFMLHLRIFIYRGMDSAARPLPCSVSTGAVCGMYALSPLRSVS